MAANIATPIRFIKSVRLYMPNLWPLVMFIMTAFLLAFNTAVVKFAITIIGEVIEIIRKVWEAIPLN
jgi:hypothetical protein